jgi:hypothetical protein
MFRILANDVLDQRLQQRPSSSARPSTRANYSNLSAVVFQNQKPSSILQYSSVNDLPLDLNTTWFAKIPPAFPPPSIIHAIGGERNLAYAMTYLRGCSPQCTVAIRNPNDLRTTIIHVTWNPSNPRDSAHATQRHIFPSAPSRTDLESYRRQYSENVGRWCENKLGRRLGNGDCWALARDALQAVGAMSSQQYIHGALIYENIAGRNKLREEAKISRGDIMQFSKAKFVRRDGMGWQIAGAPNHTAIVAKVDGEVLSTL